MDNLVKAIHCFIYDCQGCKPCESCPYNQTEHNIDGEELLDKAIDAITDLRKSNRNWRRKTQRLRKEIKELKEANKI